jgi:DNA-binding CsgD family transcriptional regulator
MSKPVAMLIIGVTAGALATALLLSRSTAIDSAPTTSRYLPEYTVSGDLILPKNFHKWFFAGSPFTTNALNGGEANWPEFHNVDIESGSYEIFEKTHKFPEGTILLQELELTLPHQNPDASRTEPSGRGYFPGPFNGADVSVNDTKRYVATGWGRAFVSAEHRRELAAHHDSENLSPGEFSVLRLVAAGQRHRRIGESFCVSEQTAKTRVKNMLAKLQAHDRVHAVSIAVQRGCLD